ncbi:MAG: hypothetical protein C5B58_05080 [Acidobacteria bacterium]|nr:MAG: hypothetical protein C5B58_05080 [Acidobacteriota bacterium]
MMPFPACASIQKSYFCLSKSRPYCVEAEESPIDFVIAGATGLAIFHLQARTKFFHAPGGAGVSRERAASESMSFVRCNAAIPPRSIGRLPGGDIRPCLRRRAG